METPISEFDLIAYLLYTMDCEKAREVPVRWLCLREDFRDKYLLDAKEFLDDFRLDEHRAEERRNKYSEKFTSQSRVVPPEEAPSGSDK